MVTSTSQLLNVGVVGLGRMGNRHASNILRLVPRARLLCVCTIASHEQEWATQNLVPHDVQLHTTFEEMIATPGLQAIIIASSTVLHISQTITALDRGIHVLCEKPIASSAAELEKVYGHLNDPTRTTTLMVAFMRRFDEDYRYAQTLVNSGAIGKPTFFRSHQATADDRKDPAYYDYLRTCGGIFIDSAIHDIDLSLMFLGEESVPKSVTAVGTAAIYTDLAKNNDADNAIGICEYWGGKIAHFYYSRTARHGYDNETQIWGLEGKLDINGVPRKNRVEISNARGRQLDCCPTWYERYIPGFVNEVNEWVEAVLDEKPMPIPLSTSLKGMIIAEALQESLRTGKKINFTVDGKRIINST